MTSQTFEVQGLEGLLWYSKQQIPSSNTLLLSRLHNRQFRL